MFSKPYEGVKHFGIWADESACSHGSKDALAVLEDALARCRDQDMRTTDVLAALDYLEPQAARQWPFQSFRSALDMQNPETRWQNLNAALNGIRRSFDQ